MSLLLRVAWRNLGRNPRRTGLTTAAGVFAMVLTLFSLALAVGSHERWIEQVVRLYPGHVAINLKGYRDHHTLDYGMTLDAADRSALDALSDVEGWAPRLETWALAIPDRDGSTGRAAWLLGVDPEREGRLSRLASAVSSGRFLDGAAEPEVVLGETLARNLGVAPGDPLILYSSDYYGSQSADRFRVVGTLAVGDPRLDSVAALVPLEVQQRFLEYPDGVTHVAVFARETSAAEPIRAELEGVFAPPKYEVLAWPDLVPDIVQLVVLDDIGNYLTLSILIVVVAFGLLNTILMSVFERVREFGVMRALGVRPRSIFALVMVESLLLSTLGIAIGLAIGVPFTLWLESHPLLLTGESAQASMELFGIEPLIVWRLTANHLVGVPLLLTGVALLAALPPAVRASRGRPVDALRET